MAYTSYDGPGAGSMQGITTGGPGSDPNFGLAQQQMALQKQLGLAPLDWAKQKFSTILPMLQGAIGSVGGGAPGANIPTPQITAGPTYSPQDIQQQKNLIGSQAERDIGSQDVKIQQRTAGQGYGSGSSLEKALEANTGAITRAGSRQDQTQAGLAMTQQNAQQRLQSQQAAAQAQLGASQIGVEAQRPWWQYKTALLGALAGMA